MEPLQLVGRIAWPWVRQDIQMAEAEGVSRLEKEHGDMVLQKLRRKSRMRRELKILKTI